MFKRRLKILLPVCMFLIPICSTVHAAVINDTPTVDPFKTWKIKFNHKINFHNITKNSISVVNSTNNLIPISLSLDKDSNSILVSPPSSGYKKGEKYTLRINKTVHSEKGNELNNTEDLSFNIREDLNESQIKNILKETEDNTIKLCYSRNNANYLYENDKSYLPFKEEFNSEEKVLNFLKNYYTEDMAKRIMTYLGTKYVDGNYAEIAGDWGESTDWENINITNIHYLDDNTLELVSDFLSTDEYATSYDENGNLDIKKTVPKHYYTTYRLKFGKGKWLVDYNSDF